MFSRLVSYNLNRILLTKVDASSLKQVRSETGAPLSKCKQALTENSGDVSSAIAWLKDQGSSMAKKKASRISSEGIVSVFVDDKTRSGIMIELNCETDFVSKNPSFQALGTNIARSLLLSNPSASLGTAKVVIPPEEVLESAYFSADVANVYEADQVIPISQAITDFILKAGENIKFRRSVLFKGLHESNEYGPGLVSASTHRSRLAGIIHVAPFIDQEAPEESIKWAKNIPDSALEVLKSLSSDLDLHLTGMKPDYLSSDSMPDSEVEPLREQLTQEMEERMKNKKNSSKGPSISEIVEKQLVKRLYSQSCFLDQELMKAPKEGEENSPSITVQEAIDQATELAQCPKGISFGIVNFEHWTASEGLQKKQTDFQAEVSQQMYESAKHQMKP